MSRFIVSIIVFAALFGPIAVNAGQKPDQIANSSRLQACTVQATAKESSRLRREHYDISSVRGSAGNPIELEVIGQSLLGTDILALQAKNNAREKIWSEPTRSLLCNLF